MPVVPTCGSVWRRSRAWPVDSRVARTAGEGPHSQQGKSRCGEQEMDCPKRPHWFGALQGQGSNRLLTTNSASRATPGRRWQRLSVCRGISA